MFYIFIFLTIAAAGGLIKGTKDPSSVNMSSRDEVSKKLGSATIILFIITMVFAIKGSSDSVVPQPKPQNVSISQPKVPYFSGLNASDIYINLKKDGFTCSDMQISKTQTGNWVSWNCEEKMSYFYYNVRIEGEGPSQISSVIAMGQSYGQEESIDTDLKKFLGYIASIPFDGSPQIQASEWVKSNVGKNASSTFGGAQFELYSKARTRMLEIKAR